jgi:hypothetical protein
MKAVTKYVTSDGKEFDNKPAAKTHEKAIKYNEAVKDIADQMVMNIPLGLIKDTKHEVVTEHILDFLKAQSNNISLVLSHYYKSQPKVQVVVKAEKQTAPGPINKKKKKRA